MKAIKPSDLAGLGLSVEELTKNYESIALERLNVVFSRPLEHGTELEVRAFADWAANRFRLEFLARPWTASGESVKTESVPRTWWDHFKLECFPAWLQRWVKPIQFRDITVRMIYRAICPHDAALGFDARAKHLEWMVQARDALGKETAE